MGEYTRRQRLEVLRSQLTQERQSFISHWKDIAELVRPRRSRFFITDANRGDRRSTKIIDATATLASRTCRSGMMSGATSPARQWFKLAVPDQEMMEYGPVKEWLHDVTMRMYSMFGRSNLYNQLPLVYGDMGDFATGCMLVEEDFEKVIQCYSFPIGSYMIANDDKLRVRTFFREFRMTVRQLVMKFGTKTESGSADWSKFSTQVKNLWDRGQLEEWIDVCHVIEPNMEHDPKKLGAKFKPFSSIYYEKGYMGNSNQYSISNEEENKFLRESGYSYFPVLAPRWEVSGEDVYGTDCPGMTALGDIKQLQTEQKRKAQGIEKTVNPAMVGPTSLRTAKASILPGDITFIDEREGTKGFRPAHEVRLDLQYLLADIQAVQKIIGRAYYEDLFLMMAQSDRREITAREIEERAQEKMFAIGPVLEQLNFDLLDPLIDIGFERMLEQDLLPPPPPELEGARLKVDYISPMAEAQKAVGLGALERFTNYCVGIAGQTGDPSIIKYKFDADQAIDEYAQMSGVSPRVVRTDEVVAQMREEEQKNIEAEKAVLAAKEASGAAKNLANADMEGKNALTQLLQPQGA